MVLCNINSDTFTGKGINMSENVNKIHKTIKKPQHVSLAKGARQNLHPILAILDEIDCQVSYDRSIKCLFVDYDFDETEGKYKKGIYTSNFQLVVEDITRFIEQNANIH